MSINFLKDKEFSEILFQAVESLSPPQLKVYSLHLLGWMNKEIADELAIKPEHASIILYQARKRVKESFWRDFSYSSSAAHEGIVDLQRRNLDLLSRVLNSKCPDIWEIKVTEPQAGNWETLIRLGRIKDACIEAAHMSKSVNRIAELLSLDLAKEYQEEITEQIEEYQAAQEGLEKSSPTGIDFDTLWRKVLARADQETFHETETMTESTFTLPLAAEDSTREEELKSKLMHEFSNMTISFKGYSGELLYRDMNSASLVFEKEGAITTDLDSCTIDLFVEDQEKRTLQIKEGEAVINFSELGISIEDYAKVKYIIKRDGNIIDEGSLGDE